MAEKEGEAAPHWTMEEGEMLSELWVSYDWGDACLLEAAWASGRPHVLLSGRYEVDFANSIQTNLESGYVRRVRRNNERVRLPPPPAPPLPPPPAPPLPAPTTMHLKRVHSSDRPWALRGHSAFKRRPLDEDEDDEQAHAQEAVAPAPIPAHEPPELTTRYEALKSALLTPACASLDRVDHTYLPWELSDKQVGTLFREAVTGFDALLDRTQSTPVLTYILATIHRGLPIFGAPSNPLNTHTQHSLQTILTLVQSKPLPVRSQLLRRIAEAFQNCQTVQAQVIDQVFGLLTGRDQTLFNQLLVLTDAHKQRALDTLTLTLHPEVVSNATGPHIQNSILKAIGPVLGLPGVARARADALANSRVFPTVLGKYTALFNVRDLVAEFITDINAQDDTPRCVSHVTLLHWAMAHCEHFDAHCIFFQEERVEEYSGRPANQLLPFLCVDTALTVLEALLRLRD
eukprot:m.236587 g.236587  ORF g.236587 m.236587 type:complete len:458 (-) comp20674_c0_seq1:44-1417(-)